ncbi:MAG TPA: PEP/pyruvate-binding domain-containing protein, partial [Aggregicoccus sp.]|nr:PEP/pyruvate-binding domain-containing protein [Aggregicoccus sp.]
MGKKDVALVGGKGANLGEMTRAGLPVPPGFVVTSAAFAVAMAPAREQLRGLFAEVKPDDPAGLAAASDKLRALVRQTGVPPEVRSAVLAAYGKLGERPSVAVRSSATAEDTEATSFAGMHETFTNVVGEEALLARLVDCWCSAYGQRVVSYRKTQRMTEEPQLAVVVQQMVDSVRSGVIFSADPSTGDTGRIVIEGAFGLGEVVVGGQVEPDTYTVAKAGPRLLEARVGYKTHRILRVAEGKEQREELTPEKAL